MNPLLSLLESGNKEQNPLAQVINLIKTAKNPVAAVSQMAQTDPRMKQVNDAINQNGGVQQAVYAIAKQRGISVDSLLNQARSMMSQ